MFSGLITAKAHLLRLKKSAEGYELSIRMQSSLAPYKRGESIAINGICLTLVTHKGHDLTFFCQKETLDKTTILSWTGRDELNVEKALKLTDALGGHIVLGHVDSQGEIVGETILGKGRTYLIKTDKAVQKYTVMKGSIAVDGISLTVNGLRKNVFQVDLIPETLERTNAKHWKKGSFVNVEFDYFGKYVYNIVKKYSVSKVKKRKL